MGIKAFKHGLTIAFVMAVLAGCTSTPDVDSTVPPEDSSVDTTGAVDPSSVSPQPEEEEVQLDTVFYFDFDQSLLKPETRAALTAHAERLKGNAASVRLEGHTDERGTREYNMALGERRANAVRDFLVLHGVNPSRIESVSYGEEYPAAVGSYESAWAKNRRVELK